VIYSKGIRDPKVAHQSHFLLIKNATRIPTRSRAQTPRLNTPRRLWDRRISRWKGHDLFPTTQYVYIWAALRNTCFRSIYCHFGVWSTTYSERQYPGISSAFGQLSAFGRPTVPKPAFGVAAFVCTWSGRLRSVDPATLSCRVETQLLHPRGLSLVRSPSINPISVLALLCSWSV